MAKYFEILFMMALESLALKSNENKCEERNDINWELYIYTYFFLIKKLLELIVPQESNQVQNQLIKTTAFLPKIIM